MPDLDSRARRRLAFEAFEACLDAGVTPTELMSVVLHAHASGCLAAAEGGAEGRTLYADGTLTLRLIAVKIDDDKERILFSLERRTAVPETVRRAFEDSDKTSIPIEEHGA